MMQINHCELSDFGAKLLAEYEISGSEIENSYFKGRNRSGYVHYMNTIGLKTLKLPMVFCGRSAHEIAAAKTRLDAAFLGKNELYMDDGFCYTVMLDDAGELTWLSEQLAECEYTLIGYQHGPLSVTVGNNPYCWSTVPYTDCILESTVSATASEYAIGDAIFYNVSQNDVLTMDGINRRVLVNGGPATAAQCEFVRMPFLVPGKNAIECTDQLTVKYYPVYL